MVQDQPVELLIVDDDDDLRSVIIRRFLRSGHRVEGASNADEALEIATRKAFEVAVFDMVMPGISGVELLRQFKEAQPACEVIILTGKSSVETAVQAMKYGAYDYLEKPAMLSELELVILKAREKHRLRKENENLKALLQRREGQKRNRMIGESDAMKEMRHLIDRAGPSDKAVLIQGASGTGKEIVARALHEHSPRADKPLVVINCAALPEALLESELFGHEKGAFTGAIATKLGLFEVADGGTLFIDEIGELPFPLQAKLLRVLEDGLLRRVGSNKERRIDVRVIAATNRDLTAATKAGKFREDLYYRINVMSIDLPPLRERNGDVQLLIRHFLGDHWGIELDAEALLLEYDWPGNVRQLINAIDRAKILAEDNMIHRADLPKEIREVGGLHPKRDIPDVDDLATVERSIIVEVLQRVNGNKTHAAKALGIHRRKLYRLLSKYEISSKEFRDSEHVNTPLGCQA